MHKNLTMILKVSNFFPIPKPLIQKTIKSNEFKRWKKKMSKSEESDYSRINLNDS